MTSSHLQLDYATVYIEYYAIRAMDLLACLFYIGGRLLLRLEKYRKQVEMWWKVKLSHRYMLFFTISHMDKGAAADVNL